MKAYKYIGICLGFFIIGCLISWSVISSRPDLYVFDEWPVDTVYVPGDTLVIVDTFNVATYNILYGCEISTEGPLQLNGESNSVSGCEIEMTYTDKWDRNNYGGVFEGRPKNADTISYRLDDSI